jgi:hypothetical protein
MANGQRTGLTVFPDGRLDRSTDQKTIYAPVKRPRINLERFRDHINRPINVLVRVRIAYDQRRRDNTAPDDFLQEQGAERLRTLPVLVAREIEEIAGPALYAEVVL